MTGSLTPLSARRRWACSRSTVISTLARCAATTAAAAAAPPPPQQQQQQQQRQQPPQAPKYTNDVDAERSTPGREVYIVTVTVGPGVSQARAPRQARSSHLPPCRALTTCAEGGAYPPPASYGNPCRAQSATDVIRKKAKQRAALQMLRVLYPHVALWGELVEATNSLKREAMVERKRMRNAARGRGRGQSVAGRGRGPPPPPGAQPPIPAGGGGGGGGGDGGGQAAPPKRPMVAPQTGMESGLRMRHFTLQALWERLADVNNASYGEQVISTSPEPVRRSSKSAEDAERCSAEATGGGEGGGGTKRRGVNFRTGNKNLGETLNAEIPQPQPRVGRTRWGSVGALPGGVAQ